jgi:hypothetical protein
MQGIDGCPSHHKFLKVKLNFPLDLPKKINPFPLHDSLGIPTFFSYVFFDFSILKSNAFKDSQ